MAATTEGWAMKKKYIVRLTDAERVTLAGVVKRLKGSSARVRRAQVLLKADADGPGWTDAEIAEAFGCRRQTVENLRERFVTAGFEVALNGRPAGAPAEVARRRAGGEGHRHAAGAAAGGVRQLVAAAAGRAGGGTGDRRDDQLRDGPADA